MGRLGQAFTGLCKLLELPKGIYLRSQVAIVELAVTWDPAEQMCAIRIVVNGPFGTLGLTQVILCVIRVPPDWAIALANILPIKYLSA